jgi:hypothetical protein
MILGLSFKCQARRDTRDPTILLSLLLCCYQHFRPSVCAQEQQLLMIYDDNTSFYFHISNTELQRSLPPTKKLHEEHHLEQVAVSRVAVQLGQTFRYATIPQAPSTLQCSWSSAPLIIMITLRTLLLQSQCSDTRMSQSNSSVSHSALDCLGARHHCL